MPDHLYRDPKTGIYYCWLYVNGKQVRRSTRCTDRRAAKDYLRRLERSAQSPDQAANEAARTVREALTGFLALGVVDRSPATYEMYLQKARHVIRLLGQLELGQLGLEDVQRFQSTRIGEGAAPETVRKELVTLRRTLTHAKAQGHFAGDPRALVPGFKAKYVPRTRHLTYDEYLKLWEQLSPDRQVWFRLAVLTGGRSSEVDRLTWADVDLDRGWIRLPGTKTAKARRQIPISPALRAVLEALPQRSGPVAPPWPNNRRRDILAACKRARVAPVTANDLRRTFASWLLQQGESTFTAAKLLGHSTTKMVELVYGHLTNETYQRAVAKLPEDWTIALVTWILRVAETDRCLIDGSGRGGNSGLGGSDSPSRTLRARPDSNGRPADSKSPDRRRQEPRLTLVSWRPKRAADK